MLKHKSLVHSLTRSLTYWIDISPVSLLLRMLQRITVDLTGASKQKPSPNSLRKAQHVKRPHHIRLVNQQLSITKFK